MARFKRKSSSRRSFGFVRRTSRRHSNTSTSPLKLAAVAAIYGALRPTLHNATSGITGVLPLGQYSDEVAYGALGYYLSKHGSGMSKTAGQVILVTEAFAAGNQFGAPMLSGLTMTSTASGSSSGWQ